MTLFLSETHIAHLMRHAPLHPQAYPAEDYEGAVPP